MQTRNLYALIASLLVLGSGAALAQSAPETATTPSEATPTTPTAAAPAEPAPAEPASPQPASAEPARQPEPTRFALHVRPNALWLHPGASARIHVTIEGAPYETYHLHLRLVDGLEPVLSDVRATADENGRAEATLGLAAGDTPTKRAYAARVLATSEDGVERGESLRVYVKPRERPTEPAASPARPEPARPEPARAEPAKLTGARAEPVRPESFVVVDPIEAFGITKPADRPERDDRADHAARMDKADRADLLRIFAILERIEARLARYEASCGVVLPVPPTASPAQGAPADAVETTA